MKTTIWTFIAPALCALSLAACASAPGPITSVALEPLWTLEGLESPESLIPHPGSEGYIVSNVVGEGGDADGDGYLAHVSTDGAVITRRWAETNLNAPKGLAYADGLVYVSDIDHVAAFDPDTGEERARILIEGAGFLNDVAPAPGGGVYVSDSANARIHLVKDGVVETWLESDRFGGINGLQIEEGIMLVTTMNAGELLAVDLGSKTILLKAAAMEDADGIAVLRDDSYILSSWPGLLYHVDQNGENLTVLKDARDIPELQNDILLDGDVLLVPNWQPGSLSAYRVVTN